MRFIILAAVLAVCSAVSMAQVERPPANPIPKPRPAPVERQPGTPMPKPRPGTPPGVTNIDFTQAHRYADRGDARTLQQAQAHADAGDAHALDAAMQHSTALVAGLQRQAFAGAAQAAAVVPMEPRADGETTVNIGAASFGGQTALGLAVARQSGRTTFTAGAGTSGSRRSLVRVGVGWRF